MVEGQKMQGEHTHSKRQQVAELPHTALAAFRAQQLLLMFPVTVHMSPALAAHFFDR